MSAVKIQQPKDGDRSIAGVSSSSEENGIAERNYEVLNDIIDNDFADLRLLPPPSWSTLDLFLCG